MTNTTRNVLIGLLIFFILVATAGGVAFYFLGFDAGKKACQQKTIVSPR